ncbi:Lrp/AsnC family transcriptional regulator [Verrucomicrobiales bacterium BCK34]|nr:Lrp/AsnC family transcriptional regulator [Verrucomicrobiales bacterium BCK34]
MEALIDLLQKNARLSTREMSERLGKTESEIESALAALIADRTILGFHAVVDPDRVEKTGVSALIEVKLTPEREGGFDRFAQRIAKFDQVTSCYLMSGGYDLTVIVEGDDLREVARFVSDKLSTIDGVVSTATHFQLKVYKQSGFLAADSSTSERLPVTP